MLDLFKEWTYCCPMFLIKRFLWERLKSIFTLVANAVELQTFKSEESTEWLLDSEASHHLTGSQQNIVSSVPMDSKDGVIIGKCLLTFL